MNLGYRIYEPVYLGSRNKAADQDPQSRNLMILSLPVLSEPDELAALLFVKVLQSEGVSAQPATFGDLKAQIDVWCKSNQLIVCLSAISPSATESARRLVKPIRRQFPELPILVGLWNAADEGKMDSGDLQTTGANQVVTTLQEIALSDSTAVPLTQRFPLSRFRKHLSGAVVKPRTSSFASSVPRRAGHRSWT